MLKKPLLTALVGCVAVACVRAQAGDGAEWRQRYHYFFRLDSPLRDIRRVEGTLEDIVSACDADEECLGFNTNGWIKSAILESPRMVWVPTEQWWAEGQLDPYGGFYTKKVADPSSKSCDDEHYCTWIPVRPVTFGDPLSVALWGVDEVDGTLNNERCPLTSKLGLGVDVYVMDTGCTPDPGALCAGFLSGGEWGSCADGYGHGDHVAGTVTDASYGVAPKATRHCVKVLDDNGMGFASDMIRAIGRIYEHHSQRNRPGVVNISLAGFHSDSLDIAVTTSANSLGLYYSLAAGNSGNDACLWSPASATVDADSVFSVAAHAESGTAAAFTNYGACTDISAPGVNIISTGGMMSGTSMAAPHVAGAMAVVLSDGGTVNMASLTGDNRRIIPRINKPALRIVC